jgi:hypothetical protein
LLGFVWFGLFGSGRLSDGLFGFRLPLRPSENGGFSVPPPLLCGGSGGVGGSAETLFCLRMWQQFLLPRYPSLALPRKRKRGRIAVGSTVSSCLMPPYSLFNLPACVAAPHTLLYSPAVIPAQAGMTSVE